MKKILSFVIVCAMMLGMVSMVSFADEKTMQIVPYNEGMENWTGSPNKGDAAAATQLLICPKDAEGKKIEAAYTDTDAEWTITLTPETGDAKTIKLKQATQYDGGTWGIVRFEPCLAEGDNQFIPVKDMKYTVTASFTSGGTTYTGTSETGAFYLPGVDPVVPGVEPEITWPGTMTLVPKFGGAENWRGSTWLLLGPTCDNEDFKTVVGPKIKDGTYDVKYVVTDETTGDKYIIEDYFFDHDDKATWADPNGVGVWSWTEVDTANTLLRLCASDYGIPVVVGHTYTVTGEITEAGELKYNITSATGAFVPADGKFPAEAGPAEGFVPPHSYTTDDIVDPPVDPDPTPVEPETVTLDVAPIFDVIENWSGKTYLIWQLPTAEDAVKTELHEKLKDGTYKMKYVITDTTAEKTYIIEEYFFDVGGEFGDWAGWYRVATGHYGITLEADHEYTLEFSVTEGETELYNGKSEAGAFVSKQAGFISDGAITPDDVPHSYTEPTTPPVTGDNAVFAIVFAAVAILGMAVVVTKKVRA